MIFGNKNKKLEKCINCRTGVDKKFNFCPHCGYSLVDTEKEMRDFGMLGKTDISEDDLLKNQMSNNLGITDKLIGSLINGLMKNLDKQFKEIEKSEIKNLPNGIKIRIGSPASNVNKPDNKLMRKSPTEDQLQKMAKLPRKDAKANVRRLSDKVVYELYTPGVESPQDVFISRSESGFELKAIGKNKIYVKNLPVTLPLKNFSLNQNRLFLEFKTTEEAF